MKDANKRHDYMDQLFGPLTTYRNSAFHPENATCDFFENRAGSRPFYLKYLHMKKHLIWMIIGCAVPLLLIFLAPALGLGKDVSLFIFIIAMFACHFLMPMHHARDKHVKQGEHGKHSEARKEAEL